MEGHHIRGYGDSQKPDVEIELMPGAIAEADRFLQKHQDKQGRLERTSQLIEGFETPYGMELLSSVHWIATYGDNPARNADEAIQQVHQWNDRKFRMFSNDHISIAWNRLAVQGWLPTTGKS